MLRDVHVQRFFLLAALLLLERMRKVILLLKKVLLTIRPRLLLPKHDLPSFIDDEVILWHLLRRVKLLAQLLVPGHDLLDLAHWNAAVTVVGV